MKIRAVLLVAVAAVALCASAAAARTGRPRQHQASFWNWLESVVDPVEQECKRQFHGFMSGSNTDVAVRGSNMYLSTNYMFLCGDTINTRRRTALQSFVDKQQHQYNSTTDLLFGQAKTNKNAAGIGAWLKESISFILAQQKAGKRTPALRFDVEYEPTSTDAERVLKMAAYVRSTLDQQFPDKETRPIMSWALDFAAMLDLPSSKAQCPAAGMANQEMLIGECMLHMCDSIDLMDFRSYAVEQPVRDACDGAVMFAAPFFEYARKLNKTVAVGFETNCGLGKYTYKISFCAPQQRNFTSMPLQYMYENMADTAKYLADTSAALARYPCAGHTEAPLNPLRPGMDLWSGVAASPAFLVEDLFGWANLAYNNTGTGIAPIACPTNQGEWQQCMNKELIMSSPTRDMFV